jgi:hypothetical protein
LGKMKLAIYFFQVRNPVARSRRPASSRSPSRFGDRLAFICSTVHPFICKSNYSVFICLSVLFIYLLLFIG